MTFDPGGTETRKRRHIDVCLVRGGRLSDRQHRVGALPVALQRAHPDHLGNVDLAADFLGARLRVPVLIGAMTGGAELSGTINRNLAAAAQQLGVGMMLGSQRIMLDNGAASTTFSVRDVAPDVLLIGNIGLAQLDGPMVPDLVKALDRVGADALAVHTNPLQEAMQHERRHRLLRLDLSVARDRRINWLSGDVQRGRPRDRRGGRRGVGGLPDRGRRRRRRGGTSWARVEQFVRYGEIRYPALAEWGIPTAQAVLEVRRTLPDMPDRRVGRHPHRDGRRQSVGDGRRRGGGGAAAAGAGDRIACSRCGVAAAVHR